MASFTPRRTRTLELETRALSHAVALAGWIRESGWYDRLTRPPQEKRVESDVR